MGFVGKNAVVCVKYCKENRHRYFLSIVINQNPRNKVLVIMKNPSTTCNNMPDGLNEIINYAERAKCHIDRTTGKVLRKIKNMGAYDEIIILNLYSLYDKYPCKVNTYYYNSAQMRYQMTKNKQCLRRIISNYKGDIICAWGEANGINKAQYDAQTQYVISLANNAHVLKEYDSAKQKFVQFLNNGYPLHGLKWK